MKPRTQKTLSIIAGLSVCLGGGRLAVNEVQLASEEARVHGLELKAAEADRDRRRVILLEHESSALAESAATLNRELDLSHTQAAGLKGQLRVSQSKAVAAHLDATQTQERLETELQRTRTVLGAELDASIALAKTRLQELDTARAHANRQAEALTGANALVRERERQRDVARRAVEAERKEHGDTELRLSATAKRLQESEAIATERARLLKILESAGVNVDRLSGERPMPRVSAVIVHVDAEASPMEVLIDAGNASGLEVGDRLFVIRGEREIACLEVFAVHPDVSATRLVRGERKLRLRPGDDVTSTPSKSP